MIRFKPRMADKMKKKKPQASTDFHRVASIQKSFMPDEEMQLYNKLNWSYKNVSVPRNNNLNSSVDGFNRSRTNYINPKE
jgi:hypothetical protein